MTAYTKFDGGDAYVAPRVTLSNGNLTAAGMTGTTPGYSNTYPAFVQAIEGKKSGKWYFEVYIQGTEFNNVGCVGVGPCMGLYTGYGLGYDTAPSGAAIFPTNGHLFADGTKYSDGEAYGPGDYLCVAVDLDNKKVWFRKNGDNWSGSSGFTSTANPATNTEGLDISTSCAAGRIYPAVQFVDTDDQVTANFGASSFAYTVPSGFTAGWTDTTSGTFFGSLWADQVGEQGHLPASGLTTHAGPFDVPSNCTLNSVVGVALYAATVNCRICIWDATGTQVTNGPGALIAYSNSLSAIVAGENLFTFASPPTLTAGQKVWIGVQTDSSSAGAYWANNNECTNGTVLRTDFTFSTVPPVNPFGAAASISNHRVPYLMNITASQSAGITESVTAADSASAALVTAASIIEAVSANDTNQVSKTIFLTSGTTWTVPSDWNPNNNSIEAIGPGGNGGPATINTNSGGGGGGGCYAKIVNQSLTPGSVLSVQIPSGGAGLPTFLKNASSTIILQADCGLSSTGQPFGAGGLLTNCVGSTKASGLGGGNGTAATSKGGGAGGSAAGPTGNGKSGGSNTNSSTGAGGGGSNGASATAGATGTAGGAGGQGVAGTGAGAAGTSSANATNGTTGTGGGGGGGGAFSAHCNGGNGAITSEFDSTHGAGGGGGGGGGGSAYAGNGGNGGTYGGGAGGAGNSTTAIGTPGTGGQGLIVVKYVPAQFTSITEAASAGDSAANSTVEAASITESVTASAAQDAPNSAFVGAVTEAVTANDTVTDIISGALTETEAATAADSASAGVVYATQTLTEAVSAADSASASWSGPAALTEAASAGDSASATVTSGGTGHQRRSMVVIQG